ncbi:MAG: YhdP family protein, partial [Gammaproteobacteria bacterium]
AGLLARFNYAVANIDGGATEIEINSAWEGMPSEFALEKLQGSFHLRVDEGRFLDIDPGGGRLFGLLSLQTLPRRLSLDFNDLFRKGFSFDRIEGAFELDHGNAYTNSLLMDGPAARIDVSGRTGLADKDYDQRVTVTPALSDSIPVAGAFFGPAGIGVGAVLYLGQKMFKSIPEQVDKFLSREYSITGGWSQPLIERI